jgi:hypothetical protein
MTITTHSSNLESSSTSSDPPSIISWSTS